MQHRLHAWNLCFAVLVNYEFTHFPPVGTSTERTSAIFVRFVIIIPGTSITLDEYMSIAMISALKILGLEWMGASLFISLILHY